MEWETPRLSHLLVELFAQGQVIALQNDVLVCQLLTAGLQRAQPVPQGVPLPGDFLTAELQLQHTVLQGQDLQRGGSRIRPAAVIKHLFVQTGSSMKGDEFYMNFSSIWGNLGNSLL